MPQPPLQGPNLWVSQEARVPQPQELLQPIAYSPVSSLVVPNYYQGFATNTEASPPPRSDLQSVPPQKPPKLPRGHENILQQNVNIATQPTLHSAPPITTHYEPHVNQSQQKHEDVLHQSMSISQPTTSHTTETTLPKKDHESSSVHIPHQPQYYLIDAPAKNEDSRSQTTKSGQNPLVSPAIGNLYPMEKSSSDDLRWMLPLIDGYSDSTKTLPVKSETGSVSQNQGYASNKSYSSPNAEASRPLFSSVGALSNLPVPHKASALTQQHGFREFNDDKNKSLYETPFQLQTPYQEADNIPTNKTAPTTAQETGSIKVVENQEPQNHTAIDVHHTHEVSGKDRTETQSPVKTYNASALSFGGPSDWEHFGDYQAEEVDDTDLYSRSRPRIRPKTTDDLAQLAARKSSIVTLQEDDQLRSNPVEPAPLSGYSSSPPSRLAPDVPIQDSKVSTEPSGDKTAKSVFHFPQEHIIAAPDSGVESYERKAAPLHIQLTDSDKMLRVLSTDDSLAKAQPPPFSYTKPASLALSQSVHTEIMSSDDFASIPTAPPIQSNSLADQRQSTEAKPEVDPYIEEPSTVIFSKANATCIESQSINDKLRPNDNTSGIKIRELPPNPTLSVQPQLPLQITPEVNADIRPNNRNIRPSSKDDVSDSASTGKKLKFIKNITTTEKVELSSRLNGSMPQRRSVEDLQGTNRGNGSTTPKISAGLLTETPQTQNTAKLPKLNGLIHQLDPTKANGRKPKSETESSATSLPDGGNSFDFKHLVRQQDLVEDKSHISPGVGLSSTIVPTEPQGGAFQAQAGNCKETPEPDNDLPVVETFSSTSTSDHPEETQQPKLFKSVTANNIPRTPSYSKEISKTVVDPQPGHNAPLKIPETGNFYTDLDAWGKASLNRYVALLKEEAKAATAKEKLSIFMIFANREFKLRAVLYGADDATNAIEPAFERKPSLHLAKALTKRSQKALPALPAVSDPEHSLSSGAGDFLISPGAQHISKPKPATLQEEVPEIRSTIEGSTIVEQPTDEMQYSPGGRPIIAQRSSIELKKPAVELTLREKVSKVFTQVAGFTNSTLSPGSDAPMVVNFEAKLSPQKPLYLAYTIEGTSEPTEYANKRKSAHRPYAASTLEPSHVESAAPEPDGKRVGILDTFSTISLDEQKQSKDVKLDNESISAPTTAERNQTDASLDLRRFVKADFDPLVSVLPSSSNVRQESVQLQELEKAINAVPDDYSFIHQSVVAWDTEAKKEREIHEIERHKRQSESERKIDALFNDNEIGYGDIQELESEFKSSEAARKADEDRVEYRTFLSSVFNVVWTRLHYEISQLNSLYDEYTRVVNETLVGKDMFEGSANQFTLAPTMSLLLALHQKLEVRHQKAFEAVLERDRRLKKTEISPWYTLGNMVKVKQLEKQFESAEKNAIVEYCKQRNIRANKLMDIFDHNTLRGVGANQDYMEAIMKSIRRIASGRAFASMPSSESGLGVEEVMKAKSITTILASSSEKIVQTFHVADMHLNAADYEISVANAKLANADAKTFGRLKEERSKEDQKLMRSLEHRLALIRKDSRRTHDEIVKLLLFLGVQNGHAQNSQTIPSSTPTEAGNENRAHKALEGAKRRNAVKDSSG